MPTAVVSGANSGIGHAFAQQLIKEVGHTDRLLRAYILTSKGYNVIAIDRDNGSQIQNLGCKHMQVDVSKPASIQAFKQQYFGSKEPIDLLLNIAGEDPFASSGICRATSTTLTTHKVL